MMNEEKRLAILNSIGEKVVKLIKNEINITMNDEGNEEKILTSFDIVISLLRSTLKLLTFTEPGYDAIMKQIVDTIKKDMDLREE